jgi:hypothetical protein
MGYYDVSVLPPIGMHRTSALRIAWRRQDGSEAYPMVLTGDEIDTIVHAIDVIRDLNS